MRIGIIITRIGGEDGVALETEKWIEVLQFAGHEVFLLSGEFERNILDESHQEVFDSFALLTEENWWEQEKAFFNPDEDPSEILDYAEWKSEGITERVISWLGKNKIDVLISENASALPFNLSMSLGLKKAVERTGIKTITHDHDFYWERGERYVSAHRRINELVREVIPLRLPNVVNVVINTTAQKILKTGYNLPRTVVIPNVMDFSKNINESISRRAFLEMFNLNEEDIVLLQPTRMVKRKGIETAIELVYRLNDKRVKLIITGGDKDENNGSRVYYEKLNLLMLIFSVLFK